MFLRTYTGVTTWWADLKLRARKRAARPPLSTR